MLRPGERIDVWVVEAALGSGGMGSVYRCHNHKATRILAAVKVLDGAVRRQAEAEKRFVREADILGQVDHPNVVRVRNIRIDADPAYLEMEFVSGESLDDRIRKGPQPVELAISVLRQTASALTYLHARGICHRDLKPANMLLDRNGTVRLVDFGLAVEMDATSRLTAEGTTFGTVSYAPPEWVTPEKLDPRGWDVYALGVTAWELLCGRYAFPISGRGTARQQAMQVVVAKQGHAPLDPGPTFPDDLRALIGAMTSSDPATRLADAAEVERRVAALRPLPTSLDAVTADPEKTASLAPEEASAPLAVRAPPAPPPPAAPPEPPPTPAAARAALAVGGVGLGVVALGAALAATALVVAAGVWSVARYGGVAPPPEPVDTEEPAPGGPGAPEPALAEPAEPDPAEPAPAEPAPAEPAPAAPAPPRPGPKPKPAKAAAWATVADVAAYVKANPEWQPGGALAGAAGSGYLPGWTAAGPPAGSTAGAAATGVTAELARRVCGSLGRALLPFSEPPDPSGRLEFRLDGDVVVIRDGATRIPAGTDAKRSVRFRCRR